MQEINLLTYIAGEIALVLLIICVFLCFHVKGLKKLIAKLEERIVSLRKTVKQSRKDAQSALKRLRDKEKVKPKDFLTYLDDEIHQTLEHHQSLNPDRDIVLDITPDTPIERQGASLRHAFLVAEKEARFAGTDNQSSWEVLQAKLAQIIQFFQSAAPAEPESAEVEDEAAKANDEQAIDNYKKQIDNLNRYKQLFFDTERKWQEAKSQAEQYHQQLLEKSQSLEDGSEFEALLANYSHAFDEVETLISQQSNLDDGQQGADVALEITGSENVGQIVIANQEEVQRLKNMAVDQHRVINELKKQLVDAKSPEEHQLALSEVSQQLEAQQRFLKEAETCTQLIEDELNRALQENTQLRDQVGKQGGGANITDEEINRLENVVEDLTNESKQMLSTIASLKSENESLKQQLDSSGAPGDSEAETVQLKQKLDELQQELLNMQTQHIELEERYLELKMNAG